MDRTRLESRLKQDEGWRSSAYKDTEGFLTIGYGFLIDERRGGALPKPVADFWFAHILDRLIPAVADAVPCWDEQPPVVQEALVNMAYQMGVDGLLQFKRMLRAIALKDYPRAAREALDSKWAKQTPNRAARAANMIRSAISHDRR